MKNLMHILLVLIITAMGALQFLDHHSLWGKNELTLSSCGEEEHSHPNSVRDHVCLSVRRNQSDAILISEQFTHRHAELSQPVYSEKLILNDRYFASLFVERAPPA